VFAPPDDLAAEAEATARQMIQAGVEEANVRQWQEGRTVPADTEQALSSDAIRTRRHLASRLLQRRSEAWSARVAVHQGIAATTSRALELQGVALGAGAALLATPFELFSRVGLDVQAASPFAHLLLLSYCNDLGGYLMPDEEHGRGGFEAGITFYGAGAAAVVHDGCLGLLRDLAASVRAA
jgi:hypothetical protein